MATHRRGPWSQGEDAYLVQLVHTQGALNWVRIAHLIGSRSPKQCRERYHQNLKPSLNHEPISPEEGLQIERLVGEMGKRWAEIARRLHGRSDNAVKNWWNGSMNRRRRLVLRRKTSSSCASTSDKQPQQIPFPRPAMGQLLAVTSTVYSVARGGDSPLPSPSVSEASHAGSCDGAPSLISDDESALSVSPHLTSPMIELPYPGPSGPKSRSTEVGSQGPACGNQFFGGSNDPPHSSFPLYRRAGDAQTAIYSSPHVFHHPQPQLPTTPPTPLQLPPLQLTARPGRPEQLEQQGSRDTRMNLSSLLA